MSSATGPRLPACIASCNVIICRSFEVEVKAPKGKVYSLVITDLFEPIVPDGSFVKVRSFGKPLSALTDLCIMMSCVCMCVAKEWDGYCDFEKEFN